MRLINKFEEIQMGKHLGIGRHDPQSRNFSSLSMNKNQDQTSLSRSPSGIKSLNFVKRKNDLKTIDK